MCRRCWHVQFIHHNFIFSTHPENHFIDSDFSPLAYAWYSNHNDMIRLELTLLDNSKSSAILLSMQKCFHSKATACCSCNSSARSFCNAYTLSSCSNVACNLRFILNVSETDNPHCEHSVGTEGWLAIKASLFSLLPSDATINDMPYFSNFSHTLAVAELLFDTTITVFPWHTILAMIFNMVCVFPVPGGPCITLIWCSKAAATAFFWLALQPKG